MPEIKNKIQKGAFRFSEHAIKRMIQRLIEPFENRGVMGWRSDRGISSGQVFTKLSHVW